MSPTTSAPHAFQVKVLFDPLGTFDVDDRGVVVDGSGSTASLVVLVSSADETAFGVRHILETSDVARATGATGSSDAAASAGAPSHRFLSSGDVEVFQQLGRQLLGPELDHAEAVSWS